MTTGASMQPSPLPSRRKLAVTTASAAGAAAVVLVTLVLPAEYAIDPLHTGRALGLTRIAAPPPAPAGPPAADVFHSDAVTITIDPYDFVEYKYRFAKDGTMVFSWKATAPLIHDFHGAPDGAGSGEEVSVEKSTRAEAAGSLKAAFSGLHGWYWENPGSTPITITLRSAGFYTEAIELRSDRTRHPHMLGPEGSAK